MLSGLCLLVRGLRRITKALRQEKAEHAETRRELEEARAKLESATERFTGYEYSAVQNKCKWDPRLAKLNVIILKSF